MKKILIVEDEPDIADIYEKQFHLSGYHVVEAFDGNAALREAKTTSPDIILLDLVLPKKSGFDVLTTLKQSRRTKQIPVVIASNLGQQEEIDRGLHLGALDYIVKTTITPMALVAKIDKIFQKWKNQDVQKTTV